LYLKVAVYFKAPIEENPVNSSAGIVSGLKVTHCEWGEQRQPSFQRMPPGAAKRDGGDGYRV
jgi:hypothetical protein